MFSCDKLEQKHKLSTNKHPYLVVWFAVAPDLWEYWEAEK